jgi:hypothetical protein
VPMAVPRSWRHWVFPNVKILFFLIISRLDQNSSFGNVLGIDSLYRGKCFFKAF